MAWFKRDDASTAAAAAAASVATSAATASATEAPETAAPDALAVLTDCCRAHTRAVVACFDVGTIAPARFAGLTERDVLLEMTVPADDGDLPPLSLATVSFSHQRRVRVFLATIAGLAPGSPMTPAVLRLRLPGEIAGADPRQIYRVPIMREAALPAWVSTLDGRMLAVRAVNISVAGILVELPAGEELEIGDRLALRLVARVKTRVPSSRVALAICRLIPSSSKSSVPATCTAMVLAKTSRAAKLASTPTVSWRS